MSTGTDCVLFVRDGETGAYTPADHHLVVQQALRALEADTATREAFPTPDSVRHMLRLRMGHLERETFTVLFLDCHNRLIAIEDLFTGTVNENSGPQPSIGDRHALARRRNPDADAQGCTAAGQRPMPRSPDRVQRHEPFVRRKRAHLSLIANH